MKIDVTKIDGYESMSAEEKLKALEEFEVDVPEPDYTGYVKKEVFDKTASELAEKKKELRDKLSTDEAEKLKEKEERDKLQADYEKLLHETAVAKNKSNLLALGYDEKLADETAEAMANGDLDKVMANQKKHLESFEKKIRAEALKDTPKPTGDGGSDTMTLDSLRKMSSSERLAFSQQHPEEYRELYNQENSNGGN